MTAKAPTPMPENIKRPKAPSAPPKLSSIVTVNISFEKEPRCPVYAFDMWMWFDNYSAYLDWQDRLEYKK